MRFFDSLEKIFLFFLLKAIAAPKLVNDLREQFDNVACVRCSHLHQGGGLGLGEENVFTKPLICNAGVIPC
jgi:hypothetical protein